MRENSGRFRDDFGVAKDAASQLKRHYIPSALGFFAALRVPRTPGRRCACTPEGRYASSTGVVPTLA
jgi:hypothetical protein